MWSSEGSNLIGCHRALPALIASTGQGSQAHYFSVTKPKANRRHPVLLGGDEQRYPRVSSNSPDARISHHKTCASLHNAAAWMVLYAAIITLFTAAAGWWWKSRSAGALPASGIVVHQWLGTSLAVIFILLAIWRWRPQDRNAAPNVAYLVITPVVVLALIYQGTGRADGVWTVRISVAHSRETGVPGETARLWYRNISKLHSLRYAGQRKAI